jgi:hypothetical protein
VVSITHVGQPYLFTVSALRDARPDAAADQAAYDVLTSLYPAAKSSLDQLLATELSAIPNSQRKRDGIRVGARVAQLLIGLCAADGSAATPPPFTAGTQPGDYRPTPPNFPAPVFTNWGSITPFLLTSGEQFRPPAPPPVSSPAYAGALNQVKSLGQDTSTARTTDQTSVRWQPGHGGLLRAGVRCGSPGGGSPVDVARVFGVLARLPGRTGGGQDSHGQQNPHDSGGRIGDGIRAVETGHGRLRGRRGADQHCGQACPAPAGLASARGPHAQYGRGYPSRGQPRGRRRVPGCGQDETAPGQVQGCRGEQYHGDQMPAGPGPGGRCCLLAIGAGSDDVPGHAVDHQHAIASCSSRCWRNASSA